MEPKDILRIVLFLLIAIFALRPAIFIKMRNLSRKIKQEENKEIATQQLLQQSQDVRNSITNSITQDRNSIAQEQMEYENELSEMEKVSV